MLILDTCAIIFDSLEPNRLTQKGRTAIDEGDNANILACSDISLWEIAMLIAKKRINPGTDTKTYLQLVLSSRNIKLLPITSEIAVKSADPEFCPHGDPADRIIAATAIINNAKLLTSDQKLATVFGLKIIW